MKIAPRFFLIIIGSMLAVPSFALAQVVITEIMYDLPSGSDTGREWVEIYNTGASAVKISTLRIFENGVAHKILGGESLAPSSYAVVADNPTKFRTDWPQFSGQLYDSAFSLSNDGETISLRDASSTELSSAEYSSADGGANGNSLNRDPGGGSFVSRKPSPGAAMSADAVAPPAPKVAKQKAVREPKAKSPHISRVSDDTATEESVPQSDVPVAGEVAAAADALGGDPAPGNGNSYMWWAGAGGLSILAAGAAVAARKSQKTEWDIVEDASE